MNGLIFVMATMTIGQCQNYSSGRCVAPVQNYRVYSQTSCPQVYYSQPVYPVQAQAQVVRGAVNSSQVYAGTTPQAGNHVGGFIGWLNSVRARHGLGAVSYDANLESWASQNNAMQSSRGLGHFVMGPARRQNSAMTPGFPGQMWMDSPGHRSALLDPSITRIGIAFNGSYWTFNGS